MKVRSVAPSGKRLRGAFQHGAVATIDPAIHAHAQIGETRHRAAQIDPRFVLGRQHPARLDHRVDMRVLGGEFLRQLPHLQEGAVVQLQPSIRAEHRDAFLEGVEGLALHAGERVNLGFELHALAHVVEQIGHAPAGIRIDHHAKRAPVRQVPPSLVDSTER